MKPDIPGYRKYPGSGDKNVLVPVERGGRPERVMKDKTKYDRKRDRQRWRQELRPTAMKVVGNYLDLAE